MPQAKQPARGIHKDGMDLQRNSWKPDIIISIITLALFHFITVTRLNEFPKFIELSFCEVSKQEKLTPSGD